MADLNKQPPSTNVIDDIHSVMSWLAGGSQYFRYGGGGYKNGVRHYFESSSEVAHAVIEPGSEGDLALMMQLISQKRIPFAVKGGGHTTNPWFSSTKGLQISMARFNKIVYQETDKSLVVGAGCLFDEVYKELERLGIKRNIVGGSATGGVGVAGFLLGGGYSLKTNQWGLGIDNIRDFDIVLPSGQIIRKVANSDPNLFKAVKGGGNNFGIVLQFTLETHEQGDFWGGFLLYKDEQVPDVKKAILGFIANSERYPKAALVATFRYFNNPSGIEFNLVVQLFYDAPTPPKGLFDFPHVDGDLGVPVTMSYTDFDAQLSRMKYPEILGLWSKGGEFLY
jgi:FAD/FMN-containing dehydrogenase